MKLIQSTAYAFGGALAATALILPTASATAPTFAESNSPQTRAGVKTKY